MINLLSGATIAMLNRPNVGRLCGPFAGNHPRHAIERGLNWAADNGCWTEYNPAAILRMLEKYRGLPNCLWINAPDVVGNHKATLFMFWIWQPIIRAYGFPVAFTLQNGVTLDEVPFDYCDALFIGGDNQFKYSSLVREIVSEAKRRGKWVHGGRVNTPGRITYYKSIGVDTFDGTGFAMFPQNIIQCEPYYTLGTQLSFEVA